MTAETGVYKKSLYVRAVIEAAEEAGIRLSALTVLYYLCKWSKGDSPVVDQSKPQIAAACKIDRKTVQIALSKLRESGVLRAIANPKGGIIPNKRKRDGSVIGAPVVYRLEIIKGGEKMHPPFDGQTHEKRGRKFPESGVENFQKRGEKIYPPNKNQYKSREADHRAAQGGGWVRPLLDAPQGGPQGAQDDRRREVPAVEIAERQRAAQVHPGNVMAQLELAAKWKAERLGLAGEIA